MAGEDLVPGGFEKWAYGPVNPHVYRAYRDFGSNPIPYQPVPAEYHPAGRKKELTDFIATCYAQFNTLTLSAMTHREKPWKDTANGQYIHEALMRSYYSQQPFARNFPFNPDKSPFYPVESDLGHAFTLDMPESEAERINTYELYRAYLARVQQEASRAFEQHFNRLSA